MYTPSTEDLSLRERKRKRRGNPSMSINSETVTLSKRSFTHIINCPEQKALSEDIEVREVQFKDGLTVKLGKVVPEHHARKDYM